MTPSAAIPPPTSAAPVSSRTARSAGSRSGSIACPSIRVIISCRAVKTARHEILTRIDAHSMLPDGYLRTAVRALMDTGAADVGGWMAAEGVTPFQRAVAWAMTSPFGVGAAANHTGGDAGPADTVYLGVYRREAIEKVGGYDETMLIAEDWELNYRIRAAGGLIWFTPELKVTYRPRATLAALAKQQFRYGRWRRVVARRYPETVNPRYLSPPVATALNAVGLALGAAGLIGTVAGAAAPVTYLTLGFAIPVVYLAGVTAVAARFAADQPAGVRARVPLVLAAMHSSWAPASSPAPAAWPGGTDAPVGLRPEERRNRR